MRESSTRSPAFRSESTAPIAAIPDANAKPCVPPSSCAIAASSAARVGLPVRAYSHPVLSPRPRWRNVEVW